MRRMLIAIVAASALDCSSEPDCGEDEECEPQTRICRGQSIPYWQYDAQHCGTGDACVICADPHLPHAIAACPSLQNCGWTCDRLWADCNKVASDGCETSIGDDSQNCGSCGARCHGSCSQGVCASLFEGEGTVSALAALDTIYDYPIVLPRIRQLFWTRADGGTLEIRSAMLDGTDAFTLASVPARDGSSSSLAVTNDAVYWTIGAGLQADGGGTVYKMQFDAGSPILLAADQDRPGNVIVVDGGVYWSNAGGGQIMALPPGTSSALVLASGQRRPGALAYDDERLFWVEEGLDGGDGAIDALPIAGGTPTVISLDSHFPDGGSTRTAGAPTAIATVPEMPQQLPVPSAFHIVIWADLPSRALWGWAGSTPFPLTYPTAGPWEPVQMFGGLESFRMFNRANRTLFDSGLYIPGTPQYDGPYTVPIAPGPWPDGTQLVSPSPIQGTWTDGNRVGSNFSFRTY